MKPSKKAIDFIELASKIVKAANAGKSPRDVCPIVQEFELLRKVIFADRALWPGCELKRDGDWFILKTRHPELDYRHKDRFKDFSDASNNDDPVTRNPNDVGACLVLIVNAWVQAAKTIKPIRNQPNKKVKGKNINGKLSAMILTNDGGCHGWKQKDFSNKLRCSNASISNAPAWQKLKAIQAKSKAEKALSKSHNRKRYS